MDAPHMDMVTVFNIIKLVAVIIVFLGCSVFGAKKWKDMTSSERKEKILAWLLQAMLIAERQFGGGTGKLKLSAVYAGFVEAFPSFANMISFETFSGYVDEVMPEMEHLLETNTSIAKIVIGDTNV